MTIQSGTISTPGMTCDLCGRVFASRYSLRGGNRGGQARVCYQCWTPATRVPAATVETLGGQSILESSPVRPAENVLGGSAKRCAKCAVTLPFVSGKRSIHYCVPCQESLAHTPKNLPQGAVSPEQARYHEWLFLQTVNDALKGREEWLPGDFLETHPLGEAFRGRVTQLPSNQGVLHSCDYRKHRWLPVGPKKALRLMAVPAANLPTLLEQGHAAEPAGPEALANALAYREKHFPEAVAVLFSPTGWRSDIVLPHNVVLVAPGESGKWALRRRVEDPGVESIIDGMFDASSETEQRATVRELLARTPAHRYPLGARAFAAKHEVPLALVVRAFAEKKESNVGFRMSGDPQREDWLLDLS